MDEDDNDDNDPYLDVYDECPTGVIGWTGVAYDHDSDGCQDHEEDLDDDNDGVLDREDSCPYGMLDWTSNEIVTKMETAAMMSTRMPMSMRMAYLISRILASQENPNGNPQL